MKDKLMISTNQRNIAGVLQLMDERHWFRVVVCFLPGLVVGKLAGYFHSGSFVAGLATVLLVVGVAVYLSWNRIRTSSEPVDEEVDERPAAVDMAVMRTNEDDNHEVLRTLVQLRALCAEAERESDQLIAIELAVDPNLTFAEAASKALARKKLQS